MALSGKPTPTGIQVGTDAYFIHNNIPQKAKVIGTSSEITNPSEDSVGVAKINYYLEGYPKLFKSTEIFPDGYDLIVYLGSLIDIIIPQGA